MEQNEALKRMIGESRRDVYKRQGECCVKKPGNPKGFLRFGHAPACCLRKIRLFSIF